MLTQLPSAATTLMLACTIPASPAAVYAAWVQPAQITCWWPQQAEIDARVGGVYHFGWPAINQHLRGTFEVVEPAAALTFTWQWDDDATAGAAPRTVALTFALSDAEGTLLTLIHGPYVDTPADQAIRNEHHLAGWQHFLPRLVALLTPAS